MKMNMKSLAVAAALTLAAGSAFAASPDYGSSTQPAAPQSSSGYTQTDPNIGSSVYRPNVAANPGETAHVIGGQTFYYGNDASGGGGDGAGE
jgi:hypothetical protein